MTNFRVIEGGGGDGGSSDGGPEGPMLEQRVARLENDVHEIRNEVVQMNERMGRMEVGIDKIHSRVEQLPTVWTFVTALIGTVFTAVATVIAVVAALQP